MKRVFNPLTEQFDMVGDNDSSILIFDNYITDQTPCDLLTLSELKGRLTDESAIVFLEKAQINNSVIVKSTFAIKDYKGLYATVAQPDDTILKDFIPIPNKIFLCKADGLLYFYDGKTLRLLSTHSGLITTITHSELVALRNNSQLIPGMKYRITDYTIRDDFEGTIDNISSDVKYGSQGLVFDIIVTASSNNSLYEEAQAVEHEYLKGETHNPIELDYSKWKLKYTIDNDNPKYSWSDPLGKGVIYEMEDEYGNVCPYDFKNILFETDDDVFLTFDGLTLNGNYHHNIIKPWIVNGIQHLNAIILTADQCFNNVFEANCRDIKQLNGGDYFANNIFQNTCHTATIGKKVKNIVISANCSNWSIGHNCYTLNIGNNNDRWIVGDNCHNITTGSLNSDWTVGKYCMYITTGNHTWQWTCEDYTSSWTAGDSCIGFTIGSGYTREDEEYYIFENENINVTIETGAEYFLCRGLTNGVVPSSIKGAFEHLIELSSLYNHTLYVKKGEETPELIEKKYSTFINDKRYNRLIPGKQYLISDYHTFYYKDQYPNMCAVSPTLPIIVTADSKRSISPYARLADGSAEIRVELYDDYKFPKREAQYLYEGERCSIEESSNVVSYNDVEYIELYLKVLDSDNKYYTYVLKTDWEEVIAKSAYAQDRYNIQAYIVNINGLGQKGLQFNPADATNTLVAFTYTHSYYPEIPESSGMGEITWMKDENGNEAPFDFKSVRWYFPKEQIAEFDNKVFENGETITGLTQYFTPNTPTPTFNGECKNNVIIFKYGIVPIIVQDSHDNKIIVEDSQNVTFLRWSYYSELHSQSTVNIYPFLQQQYCYSTVYHSALYRTPYKPVNYLGESDSLIVSQKTITENFDSINEKIALNCAILPFTKVDEKAPDIDSANKPDNPTSVVLIPNKNCLAAFDGSKYYSNWDAFTYNNVYYPSSKEYNKGSILLRDFSNTSKFGSKILIFNNSVLTNLTNITADITEKLFVTPRQPDFPLVSGYNYFCNADLGNITNYTIVFNPQTNISTPIKTSRVIIIGSRVNNIIFKIPSSSDFTTIWENGEPPVIEIGKYYIFEFTEMFVPTNKITTLFITYKSISPNKVENPNPDYVDLGLPSGTLWATKNVGATSPEDYGDYYAWGETKPKEEYTIENSLTYGLTLSELQTQGIIDDNNNLTSQFDAASVALSSNWRIPTLSEMSELINNCIIEFIVMNNVRGVRCIGPNGNSIFLPAAGIYFSSGRQHWDIKGVYFSSSLSTVDNDLAISLNFTVDGASILVVPQGVNNGVSIRPVRNVKTNN